MLSSIASRNAQTSRLHAAWAAMGCCGGGGWAQRMQCAQQRGHLWMTALPHHRTHSIKLLNAMVSPLCLPCREACEASLRRLGVDYIDLYYLHRKVRLDCSPTPDQDCLAQGCPTVILAPSTRIRATLLAGSAYAVRQYGL